MGDLTQKKVDDTFVKIKTEWDGLVAASGLPEIEFIRQNPDGVATEFLAMYQFCKETVEETDLLMPVLVEGIKITLEKKDVG